MKHIILRNGESVMVDDEDFEWLSKYKWRLSGGGENSYAVIRQANPVVWMHRLIMNPQENMDVDHIDGNGLNNQRSNLRICTRKENIRNRRIGKNNTSGYKGVYLNKDLNKWRAHIKVDGHLLVLGLFENKEDAAHEYDKAARLYFGEYAKLNFN